MRLLAACRALSLGAISSYGMSPIDADASARLSGQTGRTFCCGYAGRGVTPAAANAVSGLNDAGAELKLADVATGAASAAAAATDAATRTSRMGMTVGTECNTSRESGNGARTARVCGRAESGPGTTKSRGDSLSRDSHFHLLLTLSQVFRSSLTYSIAARSTSSA